MNQAVRRYLFCSWNGKFCNEEDVMVSNVVWTMGYGKIFRTLIA